MNKTGSDVTLEFENNKINIFDEPVNVQLIGLFSVKPYQ
jgi:hypothetical protein